MKNIRRFGVVTLVLAALAAVLPQTVSASGSIRSITAYDPETGHRDYGPGDLVRIGESIAFKVRLLNYNTNCTSAGGRNNPWVFRRNELYDATWATNNLPKIGLWISGHKRYATLKSISLADMYYTDIVFEYVAQAGDMGLPVKFCNASGKNEILNSTDQQYLLENVGFESCWNLVDAATGHECQFNFGSEVLVTSSTDNFEYPPPGWSHDDEVFDYDLSQAQMYIQTVDFDESDSSIWRTVYENKSTTVEGKLPALYIPGGATEASTVYLWTEDSDVAVLANGGEKVYHALTPDKSAYKDYTVYAANIVNETNYTFKVKGVRGAAGQTTTIYLSTTPTNIYNTAGTRLVNFVSRTIAVTNQANPEIVFELSPASITCDSAHDTPKALLTVTVDAFTNAVTVALNPTVGGSPLASGMINISESADGALNAFPATLTFPARSSMDDDPATYNYYVFGLGFVTNATYASTPQTVLFSPTVSGDGGAFAAIDTFQLKVNEEAPSIALANVTDGTISAVAGEDYPITLSIKDSYANVNSAAGYQIWWKRSATTAWALLKSGVKPDANGELDVKVKYPSGNTYTTTIRVVGPDGQRSAEVSYTAEVASSKGAILQVDKDSDEEMPRQYYEGDPVKNIRVILQNWKNEESGNIYAFLKPKNGTENYITAATFLTTTAGATGLAIKPDATNTVAVAQFTTLDGIADPGQYLDFDIVIATVSKWANVTDDNTLYTFEADTIYVYNVAPAFDFVTMTGGSRMTKGDGSETQKADQSLTKTFTWNAIDVAADMAGIKTKWTVTDPDGTDSEQTLPGNPSTLSYSYTFSQSGTYTVTVQMQDKDMGTREWTSFSFKVDVGDEPRTVFAFPDGSDGADTRYSYLEDAVMNGLNDNFQVGLSTAVKDPVVVKVTRTPYNGSDGAMEFAGAEADKAVYVTIPAGRTIGTIGQVDFAELDGGKNSGKNQYGFTLTATVTNTNMSVDGVRYCDMFKASSVRVLVANVPPLVSTVPSGDGSTTNTVSANQQQTIEWDVTDVPADMQNNLTLRWSGLPSDATYVAGSASSPTGMIQFSFSKSGKYKVTLVVKDKDGGESQASVWWYEIEASKNATIAPLGPYESAQSKKSGTYLTAAGAGEGRVFIEGGSFTGTRRFRQSWSFGLADGSADAWAWGYRVGDVDNGTLPDFDKAVDTNGNNLDDTVPAACYAYPDTGYDSFFYAWIVNQSDENNNWVGTSYPSPQIGKDSYAQRTFKFSNETEGDDENPIYPPLTIEAAFSREWRTADNLGDINQDGVPDVFAVAKAYGEKGDQLLYEAASGGSSGSGNDGGAEGDLSSLVSLNDDEDYLPATTSTGNSLIPNVVANWATTGVKFTPYYEIRGFGPGLNYRKGSDGLNYNTRGTWVSDPDFTPAETNAYIRYCIAQGVDTNTTDVFSAAFLDTVQWSPENRTDPTMDDTDGDGIPDGYEYFFWYRALVGDDEGNQMVGSKFNPDNIAQGIDITSEEIMAAFNPTVPSGIDVIERDTDGDGLTDLEELAMGTNPVQWDTDGDGMSDFYEVMWGLNPLKTLDEEKSDRNPDGDFMASWTSEETWAVITVPKKGIYAVDESRFNLKGFTAGTKANEGTIDASAGDVTNKAIEVFWYGADGTTPVPKSRTGGLTNIVSLVVTSNDTAVTVLRGKALRLIHEQVYNAFGFDPRTGWYANNKGYCGSRWEPSSGDGDSEVFTEGPAGLATNTVAFTSVDEYLLCKYRKETGTAGGSDLRDDLKSKYSSVRKTVATILWTGCTAPNMPKTDVTYGDFAETFGFDMYGADTDGDGVPDGWELYVGSNPNDGVDGSALSDADLLPLVEEYAGTDSCNAYSNTPSIYANHPGNNSGWYNKFFPTDPNDPDTDGDGITDCKEGRSWKGSFHAGRRGGDIETMQTTFTFIYGPNEGKPEGDDGTRCIRGGGLNPCTVDTDLDLLPDGWERQFAGLVFSAEGQPDGNSLPDDVVKLFRLSDGLDSATGETLATPVGWYITGGMDGTYGPNAGQPGDALTAFNDKVGAKDPATGTRRDCDWDHDGLENFQEYLVQTLRHLRYDDTETPLMGAQLLFGSAPKFVKFLPFQAFDGTAFYETCRKSGFKATSAWKFRELGYFARPPREWDRVALNTQGNLLCKNYEDYEGTGYRILLPPKGLSYEATTSSGKRFEAAGYVSTDPRRWDTDDDGMDDYWEIFHGLNPLLGSADMGVNDVIADQYGGIPNAWINAWTGWPLMFPSQPAFDAMKYPWMIGTPECDADGDGIRNAEEGLFVNITTPSPKHTDPTPLWMTDKTSPNNASFTSQYYRMDPYKDKDNMGLADIAKYPYWGWETGDSEGASEGQAVNFMFAFEENEGYDTDGDHRSDGNEGVKMVENASDPLVFSDPDRRQALYLPGWHTSATTGKDIGSVVVSRGGSDTMQKPLSRSYDLLRQFTVEAWVRPEKFGTEQVVLERVANYGPSTLSNNTPVIRANFRLGITDDDKYFAEFEGNTADSGVQRLTGPDATTNWTHLAFTFDGSTFSFYVDDAVDPVAKAENVSLIPANGIVIIKQEAGSETPVQTKGYSVAPCAFLIGATALNGDAIALSSETKWNAFTNYFVGYVDEVRVWDGARTGAEIAADCRKRYSFGEVNEFREETYKQWKAGYTRNDTTGNILPAELLQHYNFSTLPGAVDSSMVIKEPLQFTEKVLDNVRIGGASADAVLPAGDLCCGWWWSLPVHSDVYDDYHTVPWVQNTCAHLPFMDGSVPDSMYWSENFGGMEHGFYNFPNTANPYPFWNYISERASHLVRLDRLAEGDNSPYGEFKALFQFQLRSGFVGTSDLVPLGGAYAKRTTLMWDGHAAGAWAQTGEDSDFDGLPDWWEEFVKTNVVTTATYKFVNSPVTNITWDAMVLRNGVRMTFAQAYQRDLAEGLGCTGTTAGGAYVVTNDTGYAMMSKSDSSGVSKTVDENRNGLPDWWESLYAIYGEGVSADHDNDQLSNFAEFLAGECFNDVNGVNRKTGYASNDVFRVLNPIDMRTYRDEGQVVPDYFLRVGSLYLGEMFTDHDFMEDWWELSVKDADFASRFRYDPLNDQERDGWSNFAECRHSQWKTLIQADLVDGWMSGQRLYHHPQPTIALNVSYYGNQDISGKTIVTRVSPGVKTIRDTIFTVMSSAGAGSDYLGLLGVNSKIRGRLSPGSITPTSEKFEYARLNTDAYYRWMDPTEGSSYSYKDTTPYGRGTLAEYIAESRRWPNTLKIVEVTLDWVTVSQSVLKDAVARRGDILYMGPNVTNNSAVARTVVGTIDYRTGEYEIDTSKFAFADGGTNGLASSIFRVTYNYATGREWPQMLYLSIPDEDKGYVREGANVVSAFIDMNDNEKWDAGEPYGVAPVVDVGWWKTPVTDIELTDTHPSMARYDLSAALGVVSSGSSSGGASVSYTDRDVNGFASANTVVSTEIGSDVVANSLRLRVFLDAVNGVSRLPNTYSTPIFDVPVIDTEFNANLRPLFTEADVLLAGQLDLDWGRVKDFPSVVLSSVTFANLSNVTYRVVAGNGSNRANLLPVEFTNVFEPLAAQSPSTPLTPSGTIGSGRPTFTWRHNNTIGKSYPAFQLKVWKADGTTLVYDSGARKAPPRNERGVYSWTAPLYANMVTDQGQIFQTTNNYKWAVSMLDAKFTSFGPSEPKKDFRLETSGASGSLSDYGSIELRVKYFGPGSVSSSATVSRCGLIRVQAFDTPDFTGDPAGEAYVNDLATLSSISNMDVNARIIGLKAGTYYVRAFIDTNGDGVRQDWESWGYANYVGTEVASVYNPKELKIDSSVIDVPVSAIYIEDADTDNDGFPDVYEWEKNGNLTSMNPATGNTFFTEINPDLLSVLQGYANLNVSAGGASSPSILRMMSAATSSASGLDALGELISGIGAVENTTDIAVTIESFSLEDGITVSIDPVVSAGAGGLVTVSSAPVAFNLELRYKATLADDGWDTVASVPLAVTANKPVTLTGDDLAVLREKIAEMKESGAAGFFKVVLAR